ncbi:MAG: chorismate-binding protein, partial [Actinomycetota bacterium]|nr:chorismate-binding protein [Actinomycetota bacterium]
MTTLASRSAEEMPLVARTVVIEDPGPLLSLLPADAPLAWVHRDDGLVAWGEVARCTPSGPNRFIDAERWWRDVSERGFVRDSADVPGSGLLCFGSFAYADEPGLSVLVVPEVVVGRRGDLSWVTTVSPGSLPATQPLVAADEPMAPQGVAFSDGAMSGAEWELIVAEAVRRIRGGALEKVVLARDLVAELDAPLDVRAPLARLAARYPSCWTFHVDGLFGATPEIYVRRERGLVTSRVL